MISVRVVLVVVVSAVLAACNGLPKGGAMFPNGAYEFFEHPQGMTSEFRGQLLILGDSVRMVEASPACIEKGAVELSGRLQSFACGEFDVIASRATGQWSFRYRTEKTVRQDVQVCTAYDYSGRSPVCKATTTEHRERQVPVNGMLRLTRLTT